NNSQKINEDSLQVPAVNWVRGKFSLCKKNRRSGDWEPKQQAYLFQFHGYNNLKIFEKSIGFVNQKHQKKCNDFIKYLKKYH
ncbi:MAG: hypothetical protein AABW64_01465, partial [Nanoarchaeota archaeon]